MRNDNKVVETYRLIKEEYAYNPDTMCKDDERVAKLKKIIDTKLSVVDKTIILLYADLQSLRKLGQVMGVSHATIRTEVQRIKDIIMTEYESDN